MKFHIWHRGIRGEDIPLRYEPQIVGLHFNHNVLWVNLEMTQDSGFPPKSALQAAAVLSSDPEFIRLD